MLWLPALALWRNLVFSVGTVKDFTVFRLGPGAVEVFCVEDVHLR